MNHLARTFFLFSASLAMSFLGQAKKPTNFVFFLVDDMGMMDVGAFGSTFHETPNVDRLAKTGMKFNNGYASCPVCSPTRASIMTGRHPVRVDITDWIPGQSNKNSNKLIHPNDRNNLALEEVTLAEELKSHGYQTFFAGKWHLGNEGHWPTDQGFDFNIGGHHKGSPPGGYYAPWTNPALKSKKKGEYLTERLTEESLSFLEKRNKKKPFLLYLSYYNIHTPIQAYKKRIGHYVSKAEKSFEGKTPTRPEHEGKTRMRQDNPALASMVAAVDDSVGALTAKLDELGLSDNTVIIFFSDNGGLSTLRGPGPGSNFPLRAGKGWLYEGGVREPTIIRAPAGDQTWKRLQRARGLDGFLPNHARPRRPAAQAQVACRREEPPARAQGWRRRTTSALLALPALPWIDLETGRIHPRRGLETDQVLPL
jgi:arylsulfatase A-like enzyme